MGNTYSSKPWKDFDECKSQPWSKEHLEELREAIPEISLPDSKKIPNGRIVLFGPAQSGKSSFINSIACVDKKRIAQKVPVNEAGETFTLKYNQILCGKLLLSDTMGLDETNGISEEDFRYLLKGNMPKDYTFDPTNPITEESKGFNKDPKNKDRVHCAVLCAGADWIKSAPPKRLVRKLRAFLEQTRDEGVPSVLLLTKIDKVSSKVADDPKYAYTCPEVKLVVETASELLGIPMMYIYPVKNFTDESHPTLELSILLLQALKFTYTFAQDFAEVLQDE